MSHGAAALTPDSSDVPNLGRHLADRLVEIGCHTAFAVPGDFNLLLLDQMLTKPELNLAWTCNELNAGYAADGFARKNGVGCAVITFCVGGFSLLNAIGGAYSEDLPVIVISGGPNSNDFAANHVLHHTTGDAADYGQQLRAFREVTCCQVVIQHIEEAHRQIDQAISSALLFKKPVYIEISCNIANLTHPSFGHSPIPFQLQTVHTNPTSLEAAVAASTEVLNSTSKVVLLVGPRIRDPAIKAAVLKLADASEYAVAQLADAKGMFPEGHPRFMGTYWGAVSWPAVAEVVESADLVVTVGCVWTDYSSVGYSLLLKPEKTIRVGDRRVTIRGGQTFGCISPDHFLLELAKSIKPNPTCWTAFGRMYVPPGIPLALPEDAQLTSLVMTKHIQNFLTSDTALISEVGDSWFNSQRLRLPDGCEYEVQMRYGSIGWSVGATLGYAFASGPKSRIRSAAVPNGLDQQPDGGKRVLSLIGDGSFQMTAQDVSTMLRYSLTPIIILINNGGYTIEVEIHDGPAHNNYNIIKNWNYTALIEAMHNGGEQGGKLFTIKARTENEFVAALKACRDRPDHLCFLEVSIHKEDCSKELLEWGSRVAAANSRPPVRH